MCHWIFNTSAAQSLFPACWVVTRSHFHKLGAKSTGTEFINISVCTCQIVCRDLHMSSSVENEPLISSKECYQHQCLHLPNVLQRPPHEFLWWKCWIAGQHVPHHHKNSRSGNLIRAISLSIRNWSSSWHLDSNKHWHLPLAACHGIINNERRY